MTWWNALIRNTVDAGNAALVTREVAKYHPQIKDDEILRIMANAIWIRMETAG